MNFILHFDYAGLVILGFLILSIFFRRQYRILSNKYYLAICVVTLASTVFDILASQPSFSKEALFFFNTLYMGVRSAIPMLFFLYAVVICEVYTRFKKRRLRFSTTFIPYSIIIVFLVINFWTKWMFDYVDGPLYQRGSASAVIYVASYIYGLGSMGVLIASRKVRAKIQLGAAITTLLILSGASLMQLFMGDVLIEMFATAFSLIVLSVFVENPENYIDDKTQQPGFSAFVRDVKQKLEGKDAFGAVFIHATNAATFYNMLPYQEAVAFIRYTSHACADMCKKIDRTSEVYYLGHSTFAYLFANKTKSQDMFKAICGYFNAPMSNGTISFRFNARICLAECPEDFNDLESLIAFSTTFFEFSDEKTFDLAQYRTRTGNTVFQIENILEKAIREKSFSLYYQPIYDVKQKRFVSAEALLRLIDPVHGIIMPGLMIPYAERRGKIAAIGDIVLEKSFAFLSEHIKDKLDYIEVNLSSVQLLDDSIIERIQGLGKKYDVRPDQIIFEITESVAINANPVIVDNVLALHAAGYRIAMDDFGTGYSNIARLVHLPISTLKFDKSMTDLLQTDEHDSFFSALFDLTKDNGVKVLLEGVETKETADKVIALGADYIQGYYYSLALPEDQLLSFLDEQAKTN